MTLGSRIKTLRTASNLSQPEFATKVGIEQSYLSKLENDKSMPSNEMFRQILAAFSIDLVEFLEGIDIRAEHQRLIQIPDIETFLGRKSKSLRTAQRRILYASCLMIVASAALFYAGISKQLFSETVYLYESRGVIFDDEPNDVFRRWRFMIDQSVPNASDLIDAKRLEMELRVSEHLLQTEVYRGEVFETKVESGRRYYKLDRTIELPRKVNFWLQASAIMLLVAGLLGFFIERRWPKLQ